MTKYEKPIAVFLAAATFILGSFGTLNARDSAYEEPQYSEKAEKTSARRETKREREAEGGNAALTGSAHEYEFSEAVTEAELVCALYGRESDADTLLTRERAAYLIYTYLMRDGYEKYEGAANLSMYRDGLYTSPEYAGAVSEMSVLGVIKRGDTLEPQALVSAQEVSEMLSRVRELEDGTASFDDAISRRFGTDREGIKLLETEICEVIATISEMDAALVKVEIGTASGDTIWCTVYSGGAYYCTAEIILVKDETSPNGLKPAALKLSFG